MRPEAELDSNCSSGEGGDNEIDEKEAGYPADDVDRAFGEIHPTPESLKDQMLEIASHQFSASSRRGLAQSNAVSQVQYILKPTFHSITSDADTDEVHLRSSLISR